MNSEWSLLKKSAAKIFRGYSMFLLVKIDGTDVSQRINKILTNPS
jgi:uncharacterized protein (DUF952 family)